MRDAAALEVGMDINPLRLMRYGYIRLGKENPWPQRTGRYEGRSYVEITEEGKEILRRGMDRPKKA